ncbi:hypothetical protein [Desulfonema ishimotonii]|nr:hypothetical protein [Desulfonema ishimotonii]
MRSHRRFLSTLDAAVDRAGVRDAAAVPVKGFPWLRGNRFLAAMKARLDSPEARSFWLRRLQALDLAARRKEVANLPDHAIRALSERNDPDRQALFNRVWEASEALMTGEITPPGYFDAVRAALEIPDEYETVMRAVGLYPVASVPVALLTHRVRRKFLRWHESPPESLPVSGELRYYLPAPSADASPASPGGPFAGTERDPLGLPRLPQAEKARLAARFAPALVQDTAAPYDRWGEIVWDGDTLKIDGKLPTVYYYFSHAFFRGNPVLQISYVIWYPERNGPEAPWIERGTPDGLTIRVSLDTAGVPFMADVMNTCGCYHFFMPRKEEVERIVSPHGGLPPFVPRWLPEDIPGSRLCLRVSSGWHQVMRVSTAKASDPVARSYHLVPYGVLEALPRNTGGTASMFDDRGIAKGSDRIEPLIFFPMGIPNVGSMRQRGHHAIKLVGRAHFDDPALFDSNFVFKTPPSDNP